MSRLLFTYGTLTPGQSPEHLRDITLQMVPRGAASVAGSLYDLKAYPAAILDGSSARISGQVFELPDDSMVWQRLDEYEGVDGVVPSAGLFRRETCIATLRSGKLVECDIYIYNRKPPQTLRVTSGRWKPELVGA